MAVFAVGRARCVVVPAPTLSEIQELTRLIPLPGCSGRAAPYSRASLLCSTHAVAAQALHDSLIHRNVLMTSRPPLLLPQSQVEGSSGSTIPPRIPRRRGAWPDVDVDNSCRWAAAGSGIRTIPALQPAWSFGLQELSTSAAGCGASPAAPAPAPAPAPLEIQGMAPTSARQSDIGAGIARSS